MINTYKVKNPLDGSFSIWEHRTEDDYERCIHDSTTMNHNYAKTYGDWGSSCGGNLIKNSSWSKRISKADALLEMI